MQTALMSQRRAGVLLHITSLPGPHAFGDISKYAYEFIDQLSAAGFSVWQILPLGPTHEDLCPYQSLSAHAGNPQLINLEWLVEKGWLNSDKASVDLANDRRVRLNCIESAFYNFKKLSNNEQAIKFREFIEENNYWLESYALYMVLRQEFENNSWVHWPQGYRDLDENLLNQFKASHSEKIEAILFQQYIFFQQWDELKSYANGKGVLIIGDMPIFVSHDSADVWANRKYFSVGLDGTAEFVAGVPPDYFSEFGQRWGNPHYQWDEIKKDDFRWWIERIQTQTKLYDAIRIDHFRGLVQYWEIPASEENAVNGRWVDAPGRELLQKLHQCFPEFSLIAEDLGTITPDVIHLRDEFSLPGMLILQFAFSGDSDNPYLPVNHTKNSLVYTATHDNDTTVSWYENLSSETKRYVDECIGASSSTMPWALIQTAFDSIANLAIIPMQDLLSLGQGQRMNTPGTIEGNWQWRLTDDQFNVEVISKVVPLLVNSGRVLATENYDSTQVMQPNSNL
jgi:4-alpha-glucanotransferase